MVTDFGKIADQVARRYAALCWWAELDDLRQEGWVAALEAERTWRPDGGASLATYARRAVVLRLRDCLWRASKPVTGPQHRGERLRGLRAVSDAVLARREAPDLFEAEKAERWWAELRDLVAAAVRHDKHGWIAARALLGPETAAEVAQDINRSASLVHHRSWEARRRIAEDADLKLAYAAGP